MEKYKTEILTVEDFLLNRPDMECHTEQTIQSAIYTSASLINSYCNGKVQEVWDYYEEHKDDTEQDTTNLLYRTQTELSYLQEAFIFQTQYTLNLGNDYSQGGGSYSIGNINSSFSRPIERDVLAPAVETLLQKARVYQLQSAFVVNESCCSGIDDTNKYDTEPITRAIGDLRYIQQYQPQIPKGYIPMVDTQSDSHMVVWTNPQPITGNFAKLNENNTLTGNNTFSGTSDFDNTLTCSGNARFTGNAIFSGETNFNNNGVVINNELMNVDVPTFFNNTTNFTKDNTFSGGDSTFSGGVRFVKGAQFQNNIVLMGSAGLDVGGKSGFGGDVEFKGEILVDNASNVGEPYPHINFGFQGIPLGKLHYNTGLYIDNSKIATEQWTTGNFGSLTEQNTIKNDLENLGDQVGDIQSDVNVLKTTQKQQGIDIITLENQVEKNTEFINSGYVIKFMGGWNSDTLYEIGQYVLYNNLTYFCIKENRAIEPTNTEYWYQKTISQEINLDNYYTKQETDTKLQNYAEWNGNNTFTGSNTFYENNLFRNGLTVNGRAALENVSTNNINVVGALTNQGTTTLNGETNFNNNVVFNDEFVNFDNLVYFNNNVQFFNLPTYNGYPLVDGNTLNSYLTKSSASSTYLTKTDASNNYVSKSGYKGINLYSVSGSSLSYESAVNNNGIRFEMYQYTIPSSVSLSGVFSIKWVRSDSIWVMFNWEQMSSSNNRKFRFYFMRPDKTSDFSIDGTFNIYYY